MDTTTTIQEILAGLEAAAFRRLLARLALLRACGRYQREQGVSDLRAQEHVAEAFTRRTVEVDPWVYDVYPSVSARTLRRWEERLLEGGVIGLTDDYGKRSEREYESYFGGRSEMRKIALHFLADHPACSAAQLYAALREQYAEKDLPTLRTVQRFLGKIRP